MNLKKLIKSTDMKESESLCQDRSERGDKIVHDRKGSYLVEASMTLPVLILCICAMALLIHVIAICENIGFSTAEEMHKICLDAYNDIKPASVQALHLRQKILKENPRITKFTVKKFRYLYEENGISDLIRLQTEADFTVENPVGIRGKINFQETLVARGFTGKQENGKNLSAEDFARNENSQKVWIFPKYGLRYHKASCRYVRDYSGGAEYQMELEAEDAKSRGFTPCTICGG